MWITGSLLCTQQSAMVLILKQMNINILNSYPNYSIFETNFLIAIPTRLMSFKRFIHFMVLMLPQINNYPTNSTEKSDCSEATCFSPKEKIATFFGNQNFIVIIKACRQFSLPQTRLFQYRNYSLF